jgi:hypothetical protein
VYVRSFREKMTESESSKFCEVNFDQIFFERVSSIYRRICNALYVSIYQLIFQYTKKYCFSFEMHEVYFIEYVRSFRERTTENESSKVCEVNFDQNV